MTILCRHGILSPFHFPLIFFETFYYIITHKKGYITDPTVVGSFSYRIGIFWFGLRNLKLCLLRILPTEFLSGHDKVL